MSARGSGGDRKHDLSVVAAWYGDRLVFSDEALATLRREALSPSTSKAMSGCAARWAAERLLPKGRDPFGAAEIGTDGHAVLEDLFEKPPYMRSRQEMLRILVAHGDLRWPGRDPRTVAKRADWQTRVQTAIDGLWEIEDPRHVRVRGVETAFKASTTVCDIPFVGYIDRVDDLLETDERSGGISIVDYKTNKKMPANISRFGDDHGDQGRLYVEAWANETGERPVSMRLLYTRAGVAKNRDVPLSKSAMSKTLAGFRKSWKTLKDHEREGAYPTQASPLCGWCPLVNTCPVAAAEGKVDRTDLALPDSEFHIKVAEPLAIKVPIHVESDFGSAAGTDEWTEPTLDEPAPETEAEILSDPTPEMVLPGPGSGHRTSEATDNEEKTMTVLSEDKPWEVESQGVLNANSYTATAVFGLSSFAYDLIKASGQAPSKAVVDAVAQTLAHVVREVQSNYTGRDDLQDGLNTRLRGVLHSVIEANPLPFGGTEQMWADWVQLAIKHTNAIAAAAVRLYTEPTPDQPWLALVRPPLEATA